MLKLIKQLFCSHEYNKLFKIGEYFDATGFKVEIWWVHCRKCGKYKEKRYF